MTRNMPLVTRAALAGAVSVCVCAAPGLALANEAADVGAAEAVAGDCAALPVDADETEVFGQEERGGGGGSMRAMSLKSPTPSGRLLTR